MLALGVFLNLPDQGVDLDGVNVVQLLNSSLDLALVGLDIDDEDQGVVLLDLLHGALSVERVQNDLGSVELGLTGDGDAGVLGRPRELQGLGAVEGGRGANLAGLVKLWWLLVDIPVCADGFLCVRSISKLCRIERIQGVTYGRSLHDCLGGSIGYKK